MVWNVQVTSSAANLTFGNHPNELADEFFRFFSAHVATGEFDPTDVKSRTKIQAVQPHAYAVRIVDSAVYEHFRPKFAACNHAGSDSPEIRVALQKDLHSVLASSGPNCALFPHLALVRSGGSCFSVSLNRIDNNMNYPPSNVQVRNQMFLHAFVCL